MISENIVVVWVLIALAFGLPNISITLVNGLVTWNLLRSRNDSLIGCMVSLSIRSIFAPSPSLANFGFYDLPTPFPCEIVSERSMGREFGVIGFTKLLLEKRVRWGYRN